MLLLLWVGSTDRIPQSIVTPDAANGKRSKGKAARKRWVWHGLAPSDWAPGQQQGGLGRRKGRNLAECIV